MKNFDLSKESYDIEEELTAGRILTEKTPENYSFEKTGDEYDYDLEILLRLTILRDTAVAGYVEVEQATLLLYSI